MVVDDAYGGDDNWNKAKRKDTFLHIFVLSERMPSAQKYLPLPFALFICGNQSGSIKVIFSRCSDYAFILYPPLVYDDD